MVDETRPPPLPEANYAAAARAGAAVYRIDPQRSLILVRVGRSGKMQRLGHDHAIASEDVHGFVAIFDDLPRSHADVVFPLRNLLVDKAEYRDRLGLDTEPTAADVAGTYGNMFKVLEPDSFPWAAMEVRFVSGSLESPQLSITITLHGQSFEYLLPATIEVTRNRLAVSGEAVLRHSDFALEPYSAAGGLLRVADELNVEFQLVAVPRRLD
jgi:hypothetical protein